MATFNTYVKLGTRGNSLLSFNLSGCTNSNTNSCTALPNYQNVLHTNFDGMGLHVTGLTLHSIYFIYVEPNRQVSGSNCNPLPTQMIPITGIPTPTPTPSPTPTNTPTPLPTATPSPTPTISCSFDGTVVYGLSGTAIPTATPTSSPATYTPTPTNTTAPAGATYTPTPTNTTAPAGATYTPTPTPTFLPYDMVVYSGGTLGGACSNVNGPYTVYYRGSLGIGTDLFTDSNCTVAVNTPGYYWSDNATVYLVGLPSVEDGRITDIVACPTPTPTPTPSFTFNLYVSETSGSVACAGGDTPAGSYHQFVITGNTTNFCTATSFTCDFITSYDLYQFWVSDGTNSRSLTRTGGQGSETASPDGACVACAGAATATYTPTPPPTYTPTPTPLPEGVSTFGSSDSNYQQCGYGFDTNDYEFDRTYYVDFTSARSMGGYVVVYLNGGSPIQLPFNQNDTSASLIVSCGCGSSCESIEYVMSIIYSTPTPTPEPLSPTNPPAPTNEGDPLEPS
jgi:hypothetical protein